MKWLNKQKWYKKAQNVMGERMSLVESQKTGGVLYELYYGDKNAVIRVYDTDAQEVIHLLKFPDKVKAKDVYDKTIERAGIDFAVEAFKTIERCFNPIEKCFDEKCFKPIVKKNNQQSISWYKKAQFSPENTRNVDLPLVIIEPYEPIVQEVVDELMAQDSNFFSGVNKIKIDMGYGQFGSVKSDNPADININFDRIKQELQNKLGSSFDINNPEHRSYLKDLVKRTIVHERAHVSDASQAWERDPQEFLKNPFPGGEFVAEKSERSYYGE